MNLWTRTAEAANIVSAVIAVYLLVKPQGGAPVSQVPIHVWDNLPLMILCVSVLVAAVLNVIVLRRKSGASLNVVGQRRARTAALEGLVHREPDSAQSPSIISSPQPAPFGVPTVLPDGRIVISCSHEDLQAAFRDHTMDLIHRVLDGKWIKISGNIKEIYSDGLVFLAHGFPIVLLRFGKGWQEQLSDLRRGSSVTIRGKMMDVDPQGIRLGECELL